MSLKLLFAVDQEFLAMRPTFSQADECDIAALGCAARILKPREASLAEDIVTEIKNYHRRAFHADRSDAFGRFAIADVTFSDLQRYFPLKYRSDFFIGKLYDARIRKFLRLADQRFEHVKIIGNEAGTDFAVLGYVPGGTHARILLGRIHESSRPIPSVEEIGYIVSNRQANLEFGRPVGIAVAAGVLLNMALIRYGVDMGDYGIPAVVLGCMTIAASLARGFNSLKNKAFAKQYPKLEAVM